MQILGFGEYGVDLFFVISGFIITVSTLHETSASHFIAKRAVRIVPLYWLVTTIYLVIGLIEPNILRSTVINAGHVISSFLFIPHYHPIFSNQIWPLVIPGWSLNYEWFFYVIFALAIALSPRYRTVIAIGILVLLASLGRCISPLGPIGQTYTGALLIEFIFGIIVGEAFLAKNIRIVPITFLFFLFFGLIGVMSHQFAGGVWQSLLFGPASAALLSGFIWLERRGVPFSNRIIIALGDASYSIYLTHVGLVAGLRVLSTVIGIHEFDWYLDFTTLFFVLSICSFVGWSIFILVERPMTEALNSRLSLLKRFGIGRLEVPKI